MADTRYFENLKQQRENAKPKMRRLAVDRWPVRSLAPREVLVLTRRARGWPRRWQTRPYWSGREYSWPGQ